MFLEGLANIASIGTYNLNKLIHDMYNLPLGEDNKMSEGLILFENMKPLDNVLILLRDLGFVSESIKKMYSTAYRDYDTVENFINNLFSLRIYSERFTYKLGNIQLILKCKVENYDTDIIHLIDLNESRFEFIQTP